MLEKNQDPFTALTATRASTSGIIFSAKTLEIFKFFFILSFPMKNQSLNRCYSEISIWRNSLDNDANVLVTNRMHRHDAHKIGQASHSLLTGRDGAR